MMKYRVEIGRGGGGGEQKKHIKMNKKEQHASNFWIYWKL